MEIVIDIDDNIYKSIKNNCYVYQEEAEEVALSIIGGITLPKGHGRLIDADEFHHIIEDMPMKDTDKWFNWLQKVCNRLADAPTIVEADTESEG